MLVTLSCDHRVIDGTYSIISIIFWGQFSPVKLYSIHVTMMILLPVDTGAIGAEWLKAFKGYIENPESMLL